MENEILEILKRMENDIHKLNEGQQRFEERQLKFEERQLKFEESQQRFENRQLKFEEDLQSLKEGQQRIEKKIDITYDQVARTAEDITNIKDDIGTVERVTVKNWSDIVKLKAIK